jgi:hypothetical protein
VSRRHSAAPEVLSHGIGGDPPFPQSHTGLRVSHCGEVDRTSDAQHGTKQA